MLVFSGLVHLYKRSFYCCPFRVPLPSSRSLIFCIVKLVTWSHVTYKYEYLSQQRNVALKHIWSLDFVAKGLRIYWFIHGTSLKYHGFILVCKVWTRIHIDWPSKKSGTGSNLTKKIDFSISIYKIVNRYSYLFVNIID